MGADVALEGFLMTSLKGLGVAAAGFVFAWFFMKQYFKLVDRNVGNVNLFTELTAKVSALQESTKDGLGVIADIYKHLESEMSRLQALYESQHEFRVISTEIYRRIDAELAKCVELVVATNHGIEKLNYESHFVSIAAKMGFVAFDPGSAASDVVVGQERKNVSPE